ncbi:MAG: MFS transporter [Trueperaceae bacterium]
MTGSRNSPALWVICGTMAAAFTTHSMVAPLVPLLGFELGASPGLVGVLVSAGALLPLFFAIPTGGVVDRFGPKRPIILGAIGLALAPVAVAMWPSLLALGFSQLFVGLFHLVLVVAAQTYVASLGSGKLHEVNFGWYTTFLSVGQLIGPVLAGFIADSLGFVAAFAAAGAVAVVAVVLSPLIRKSETTGGTDRGRLLDLRILTALPRTPGVKVAMVVSASVIFALSIHQAFFPVYLDLLEYPATVIGALISARALASVIIRPFMPRIVSLLTGRSRSFLATLLAAGASLMLTGVSITLTPLALASVLLGIGLGVALPLSMVSIVDHVKHEHRGVALGLRLTGNYAALVVGPLLLGLVAELAGLRSTFILGSLLLAPACVLLLRWR